MNMYLLDRARVIRQNHWTILHALLHGKIQGTGFSKYIAGKIRHISAGLIVGTRGTKHTAEHLR